MCCMCLTTHDQLQIQIHVLMLINLLINKLSHSPKKLLILIK